MDFNQFDHIFYLFQGCRHVWLIRLSKAYPGSKSRFREDLKWIIRQLISTPEVRLVKISGDLPSRASLRRLASPSGIYGCEICLAQSKDVFKRRRRVAGRRDVDDSRPKMKCWPASTMGFPLRTLDDFREQSNYARQNPGCPAKLNKGITGPIELLDLPNFNILNDIPVDSMHMMSEGVCKLLCTLTINSKSTANDIAQKRSQIADDNFNLLDQSLLDPIFQQTKTPSEV